MQPTEPTVSESVESGSTTLSPSSSSTGVPSEATWWRSGTVTRLRTAGTLTRVLRPLATLVMPLLTRATDHDSIHVDSGVPPTDSVLGSGRGLSPAAVKVPLPTLL